MTTKICKKFEVSGKVQGVWFRSATQKEALKLNITGWVKNNESGNVEILACGTDDQLKRLGEWLWKGPLLARVKSVKSEEVSFEILQTFTII